MGNPRAGLKKVLVTGAKGMLGSDLVKILQPHCQVIPCDLETFDFTNKEETLTFIQEAKPEFIINTAAYTQVDKAEEEKKLAFKVNGEGVKNLSLICRKEGIKLFHLSTDYVFDGKKGRPYQEEDEPNPLSIYGKSKLKGEEYIQKILDDFIILRTAWLFGKNGKNFVQNILKLAEEKKELKVVDDQWGSPTYTVDLSKGILALLKWNLKGIYHLTNQGFCSWYQLAAKILELKGMEREVRLVPLKSVQLKFSAPRPSFSVLSCDKLKRETGIVLPPWEVALRHFLAS